MKNTKLIQFAQSFILLPVLSMSPASAVQPVGPVAENVTIVQEQTQEIALLKKFNITNPLANKEDTVKLEEESRAKKAQAIDAYFKKYDMPLAGHGMKMVIEAEKNDLDWRLLPAIAVRESTGGKHACKKVTNSFFGWGSCKINFKTIDHAIEIVAHNLGGNNPNTDHYYADKTTYEILQTYNPPSIVKRYAEQVINIMDVIGSEEANTIASNT